MLSHYIVYKLLCVLLASFGFSMATLSHAMWGGDDRDGGVYRNNYYGYYYDANPGLMISVPYSEDAIYINSCLTTQFCDPDKNCTLNQVYN